MKYRSFLLLVAWIASANFLSAQQLPLGNNKTPLLRLEAGGHTSSVTSLVFSPDGDTLYSAGYDKVVRVWQLDPKTKKYELDPSRHFRVPIAPGLQGAINAMALSPDGTYLAVGGLGVMRGTAGYKNVGKTYPVLGFLSDDMRQDQGMVYVFNTKNRQVKLLRGHTGPLVSLAFSGSKKGPLLLASAAQGWDGKNKFGEVLAWDVAAGKKIGTFPEKLPRPRFNRPALAVISNGPKFQNTQVIIAWGDGKLRSWNLANPENPVWEAKDGVNNASLAYLENQGILITGSHKKIEGAFKGALQLWEVSPDKLTPAQVLAMEKTTDRQVHYSPKVMTLVSSVPGGVLDHLAVINFVVKATPVREPNQQKVRWVYKYKKYELQLHDLRAGRFGQLPATAPLWDDVSFYPVLASTPQKGFVATAGNPHHKIQIYSSLDLRNRKKDPASKLRSVGETLKYAAFATKKVNNKIHRGLLLNNQPNQGGKIVYDFNERELSPKVQGWTIDAPNQAGWRIQKVNPTKQNPNTVLTVTKNQQIKMELSFPKEKIITYQTLTPTSPAKIPLLAVAVYSPSNSEVSLDIYNAENGRQIRRLVGHLAPIQYLSFSGNGKLLASAATDQTVCVWTTNDLDKTLYNFGRLPGFAIQKSNGKLVLKKFKGIVDTTPAPKGLQEGAVIEGLMIGNNVKLFNSPSEIYDLFWISKPGSKLIFRIQTPQGVQQKVPITVAQGIDERRPLFHLFVTKAGANQKRGWLGWNPIGFYDSSGFQVEKYLGWHFNTGNAAKPAAFSTIQNYGKKVRRPGLLQFVVEKADLLRGVEQWKAKEKEKEARLRPVPITDLVVADHEEEKTSGHYVVRDDQVRMHLTLANYKPRKEDTVEWQISSKGEWQAWQKDPGANELVQVAKLPQPGLYKFRVLVHLHQKDVQPDPKYLTVRYQKEPPQVKLGHPDVTNTKKPNFLYQATVTPGTPGEKVDVELVHRSESKKSSIPLKPGEIKKNLLLEEGTNFLTLVARNNNALPNYQENETTSKTIQVIVAGTKPVIRLDSVQETVGNRLADRVNINSGEVVVRTHRVYLLGEIKGKQNLQLATWSEKAGKSQDLKNFDKDSNVCAINEELVLKPGPQKITLQAQTKTSKVAKRELTIVYRPQLPYLVIEEPVGPVQQNKVTLKGRLIPPPFTCPYPFAMDATVKVNGKVQKVIKGIKSKTQSLEIKEVVLGPNHNRIEVKLEHEWGGIRWAPDHKIRFIRPPVIRETKVSRVKRKPFVHLEAKIQSATPINKDQVEVLVNSNKVRFGKIELAEVKGTEEKLWQLTVSDVPVQVGANKIRLWVSNEESKAETPGEQVAFIPVLKLKPPEVAFLSPAVPNFLINVQELTVRFQIRSEAPLKQVILSAGEEVLFQVDPKKLAALKPGADGLYNFFRSEKIKLGWGDHHLTLAAVNEDGSQEVERLINVVAPPVEVRLDHLKVNNETIKPKRLASGKLIFPPAQGGLAMLHGSVTWSQQDDERLKQTQIVEVYVNGFRQFPVRLQPAIGKKRERTFRAKIMFNLAKKNKVEVRLPNPDLVEDSSSRLQFKIDCANPVQKMHLHVVIVAPNLKQGAQRQSSRVLKEQFLKAINAQKVGPKFQTTAFQDITVHPPVTGYVRPFYVINRLKVAAKKVQKETSDNIPNVLMFYYQGVQTVTKDGTFFWTSETYPSNKGMPPTKAISMEMLVQELSQRVFGAPVMLLDVAPVQPEGVLVKKEFFPNKEGPPDLPSVAGMRYSSSERPKKGNWARLIPGIEKCLPNADNIQLLGSQLASLFSSNYGQHIPPDLYFRLRK